MPPALETIELQDKKTNQDTGLEEVQDYSHKWLSIKKKC